MPIVNLLNLGAIASTAVSRRLLTTSATLRPAASNLPKDGTSVPHSPDSYAKDVDYSPAPDHRIYRVDPLGENVQKPYEAPVGHFSRTGAAAGFATMCVKFQNGQTYPQESEAGKPEFVGVKS